MTAWTVTRKHDLSVRLRNAIGHCQKVLDAIEHETQVPLSQSRRLSIASHGIQYVCEKLEEMHKENERV